MSREESSRPTEQSQLAIDDWLKCPNCGTENVYGWYGNGRIRFRCEDCNAGFSKLVGKHRFRSGSRGV